MHLAVVGNARLAGRGRVLAGDADGSVLTQVDFGRGTVTAVADDEPWLNEALGCHDHAHILYRLVEGRDGVWLVDSATQSDWQMLALRHGRALIASAALLLVMLLWRFGGRFGPVLERATDVRRERSEQFRAVGEFYWRHRDSATLLAGLRELVRRNARRRVGDAEAVVALAARAGIDPHRAHNAQHAQPGDERQLILVIRCLKELVQIQ